MTPPLDKAAIRGLIPHAGAMCLLDEVIGWDDAGIRCRTGTHRDPAHPLARDGRLAALHLIEYGAQAMALHGGLLAQAGGGVAAPGVLVSVRDVRFGIERFDDIVDPLDVRAMRLVAHGGGWLYAFEIAAGNLTLASGRVAVIPVVNVNLGR